MSNATVALLSLVLMLLLIYGGMHVAFVLGAVSFVGVWLIRGDPGIAANLLAQACTDAISSHVFGVVPLFVLTGFVVAHADIGKDAFEIANQLFRRVLGGLGVATVAANAVFAAITGISIASAAVFTRVAVPQMLRFGYSPKFAVGVVTGSSVLGMLIPPSLLMILYAFLANQSVGDMFAAGVVPGLLLAVAFSVLVIGMARWRPESVFRDGRPVPIDDQDLMPVSQLVLKTIPLVLLIGGVLGGMYAGWLTSSEAGAVGALMALVIAFLRRKLTWKTFWAILTETGQVTVSVSFLIICANIYTRMLAMSGAPQEVVEGIAALGLGVFGFMVLYSAIILLLGTIIDSSSIMLIVLPLMLPVAQALQLDLIWFGVVTVVAVEVGLLTPPFGLSAYTVKATLSREHPISIQDIFSGTLPFTLCMVGVLLLIILFPKLALML
jgi:C4-dicarboxylate transporter DctM subunit